MQVAAATLYGLIRAAMASGVAWVRRVGEGALDEVKPELREQVPDSQLRLWTEDDTTNALPWRIPGGHPFTCRALQSTTVAEDCVKRQLDSESSGTRDTWRGQGRDYPTCTSSCCQGVAVRAALEPTLRAELEERAAKARKGPARGSRGFGIREKSKKEQARESSARRRLERAGLLDEVRSMDDEAAGEEESVESSILDPAPEPVPE